MHPSFLRPTASFIFERKREKKKNKNRLCSKTCGWKTRFQIETGQMLSNKVQKVGIPTSNGVSGSGENPPQTKLCSMCSCTQKVHLGEVQLCPKKTKKRKEQQQQLALRSMTCRFRGRKKAERGRESDRAY